VRPCLPEITKFARHGQSGAWVSDFMSHTAGIADDLCFVKSMHTTQVNHAPAICFFLTGHEMPGRPSAGAWLTYGLGSETEELPGFVVMTSRGAKATRCCISPTPMASARNPVAGHSMTSRHSTR